MCWRCLAASSVGTLLLLMFSVTWRRFLLLGVPPTTMTFSKPFRRYLILFVLTYFAAIFGATFLAQIVLSLLPPTLQTKDMMPVASIACVFIALAAVMLLIVRFIPLFTAAAIDHTGMKLREAAACTNGNVWRFAACWVLIVLAVNLVNNAIGLFLGLLKLDPASAAGSIVIGALSAATMVATASLTASLAALAYDFLVRGGGPKAQTV